MIVYRELKSVQEDLGIPLKTLFALSNNLEKHYKIAYIPKKDGTQRKLCVPDYILKKAQRAIADVILSGYSVSRFACGYVYNKSILHNALPHVGKARILKLDIDGFFDHISYSQVKDIVFYKEKFSEPVRVLLVMLCYFRESLPQGAPSSPAITNIIMREFDEKVGAFCAERGVEYTRYCDDMTFSGDFEAGEIIAFVKSELRAMGLFLKNRKTAYITADKRQVVTGVVVNEKPNLPKEYRRNIRREIYYIKKFGLDEHIKRAGESDGEKYLSSLKGRVAFVLQITPDNREFIEYNEFLKNINKNKGGRNAYT